MSTIDSSLRDPKGEQELIFNFNALVAALAANATDDVSQAELTAAAAAINAKFKKYDWFFPDGNDIIAYPDDDFTVTISETDYILPSGTVAIAGGEGSAGSYGMKYTFDLGGEAAAMPTGGGDALFGASSGVTHVAMVAIKLPTDSVSEVTAYFGSTNKTISASDIITISGESFYVHVLGVYDNSGTETLKYNSLLLEWSSGENMKQVVEYAFTVTTLTLAT